MIQAVRPGGIGGLAINRLFSSMIFAIPKNSGRGFY